MGAGARRSTLAAVAAVAALLLAFATSAEAKTYVPNKTDDPVPNGCTKNDCSLREAVIAANGHAGPDKILLSGGQTYHVSQPGVGENAAATGDLDVNGDSLSLRSSKKRQLATVDAGGTDRVFDLGPTSATAVTFKSVTISGGNSQPSSGDGGGVEVHARARVKILDSEIVGNSAAGGFGGGLNFVGRASVLRSTVSGNNAQYGAGVAVHGPHASLSATNSTVAGNTAQDTAGGIDVFSSATARLRSLTVVRNHGNADNLGNSDAGGLYNSSDTILKNSIVALNTVGGSGKGPDCYGPFTSAGANLFSFLDVHCQGFAVPPNIKAANPKLGTLKDNGGLTRTIALKKGSAAINGAKGKTPKRDQRNYRRLGSADIGAYERGATPRPLAA